MIAEVGSQFLIDVLIIALLAVGLVWLVRHV